MKKMNHAEYQRKLKSKSIEELKYIIKDAREAEEAMPMGENAGYYADEQHYAAMEIAKREKNAVPAIRALLGL
jgi:hypothetical protein